MLVPYANTGPIKSDDIGLVDELPIKLLKAFDPFDFRFNILEYEQTGAA